MENERLLMVIERFLKVHEEILQELRAMRTLPLNPKIQPNPMENLIDSVDVKSILKIGESTLYRLKRQKYINTVRVGRRDYYSRVEIEKLVDFFKK